MNYKRGFKRITLLISIVAALGVGAVSGFLFAEDIEIKNGEHEKYQGVLDFWEIWEKGGTETDTSSGKLVAFEDIPATGTTELRSDWRCNKKEVVEKLTKYRGSWFTINGKSVYLEPRDVFIGADKSYVNLSLEELEEKAKGASPVATSNARFWVEHYKYTPIYLIILYSILAGLAGGAGSFVSVWLAYYILFYFLKWPVFYLFRWLALGFREDEQKQ